MIFQDIGQNYEFNKKSHTPKSMTYLSLSKVIDQFYVFDRRT